MYWSNIKIHQSGGNAKHSKHMTLRTSLPLAFTCTQTQTWGTYKYGMASFQSHIKHPDDGDRDVPWNTHKFVSFDTADGLKGFY
jgi:hypothetical protein